MKKKIENSEGTFDLQVVKFQDKYAKVDQSNLQASRGPRKLQKEKYKMSLSRGLRSVQGAARAANRSSFQPSQSWRFYASMRNPALVADRRAVLGGHRRMLSTEVENADFVEDKPAEKKVDRHAEDIRAAAVKAAKKAALAEKERGDLLFKARIRAYFRPNMNNFLSNEIPSRTKLRPLIKPFLDKCKEALSPGQKAVILSGDEMSREAVQLLMSTWMNWLREGARGGTGSETKFNVTHDPDLDDHADMTQPHDWSPLYRRGCLLLCF